MRNIYFLPLISSFSTLLLFFFFFDNQLNDYVALAIYLIALVIWWSGIFALKDSFTTKPEARKLVTHGIYKTFRHPIYVGNLSNLFSWFILTKSKVILLIWTLFVVMQVIRAKKEEKVLVEKFGKKYINYKKKTLF